VTSEHEVFIICDERDEDVAERLSLALERLGVKPWLERWEIGPGDVYIATREAGLQAASAFLLCVGRHGATKWVEEHYWVSLGLKVSDDARVFIPVLLPEGSEAGLPLFATPRRPSDLRNEDTWDRELPRLVAAIRRQKPPRPSLLQRASERLGLGPAKSTPVATGRPAEPAVDQSPLEKVTADEFASLLDRHSPWTRFRDACKTNHHLVMWAAGDPRQNIPLFYERIRSELSLVVKHACYSCDAALGDGTVAAKWAHELMRVVPGYHRGMTLPQALRAAASERPAIFLLANQRGALEDDKLSPRYVAELVKFVTHGFIPAALQVGHDGHAVRLFLGIQTNLGQRKSTLATALRTAMRAALKDHGERLGMWEEEEIELPRWNDVKVSMEELLPREQPLDDDERDALEGVYDAFRAIHSGTLHQLASQLYPLYDRFHDARTRSTSDG
jgi:TIR domain